jgi:hypothetical protein
MAGKIAGTDTIKEDGPQGRDVSQSTRKLYFLSPTHKSIIGKKDLKTFPPTIDLLSRCSGANFILSIYNRP